MTKTAPRLGIRENLGQFSLLVLVNAFVGAMIGLERSILPAIAEEDFGLAARSAILSFIVAFGVTKALTNYVAGRLSDRVGRKPVLVAGWLIAAPVPFLLMWAPSWSWILVANVFLGVSQGLTWSTTVIMKIDLAGAKRRGLAMGLNEFAGYVAVAVSALATGWIAADYGLRPEPFYLGVAYVVLGLGLSVFLVRETLGHVDHEAKVHGELAADRTPTQREVFWRTTIGDRNLSSVTQAGLVNNLNDGMAWGLFPLFFAAASMNLDRIAILAAIYPATQGLGQLATGAWSDRIGRKPLIVTGMWIQAIGIGVVVLSTTFAGFAAGAVLLGLGTAFVYPTLLAAIGDVAHPSWRGSSVGVYRLWRDLGYAIGAVLSGLVADAFGLPAAIWLVAGLTFMSGTLAAVQMSETLRRSAQLSSVSTGVTSGVTVLDPHGGLVSMSERQRLRRGDAGQLARVREIETRALYHLVEAGKDWLTALAEAHREVHEGDRASTKAAGKVTRTTSLPPPTARRTAQEGVSGAGSELPYLARNPGIVRCLARPLAGGKQDIFKHDGHAAFGLGDVYPEKGRKDRKVDDKTEHHALAEEMGAGGATVAFYKALNEVTGYPWKIS